MKTSIIAAACILAASFALGGCKEQTKSVENPGLELGKFKGDCLDKNGKLSLVSDDPNDWKCELPDGSVLLSKTK